MKVFKKLLKDSKGYTLLELIIVIAVFAIAITPVYRMLVSGAKIQNAAEETYEATQYAQSLLQEVKTQIDIDVTNEYDTKRNISAVGQKEWLKYPLTISGGSIIDFLNIDPALVDEKFHKKFKTDTFLYEIHIWHLEDGEVKEPALSFVEYTGGVAVPTFSQANTSDFTKIEISDAIKEHFFYKDTIEWTKLGIDLGEKPKSVAQITYKGSDDIFIHAKGIVSTDIAIDDLAEYDALDTRIKVDYKKHTEMLPDETITHELILKNNGPNELLESDLVYMAVDLTTFVNPSGADLNTKVIRIENQTKATVVVPVFNETLSDIEIYPIQKNKQGNIIVEKKKKLAPSKNFVIGIIVRDAYNSNFGEPNKILSKIVDVYSYDYNNH